MTAPIGPEYGAILERERQRALYEWSSPRRVRLRVIRKAIILCLFPIWGLPVLAYWGLVALIASLNWLLWGNDPKPE